MTVTFKLPARANLSNISREMNPMLQIYLVSLYLPLAVAFIVMAVIAFGWLTVHMEQSRHYSVPRIVFSLVLGALLLGFGIHFMLLWFGI
jgi:TRAP-type C4-dicarboxylate transport system permease small subunit